MKPEDLWKTDPFVADSLTDLQMIGRRVLYGHVQLDITTPGVRAHLGISGTVGASNQGTEAVSQFLCIQYRVGLIKFFLPEVLES